MTSDTNFQLDLIPLRLVTMADGVKTKNRKCTLLLNLYCHDSIAYIDRVRDCPGAIFR
jgi:hypothetical protein